MKQMNIYTYLGTNGTLTTPIYLEGIYSIKKVRLIADENKMLTKDNENYVQFIDVPEKEVESWHEVNQ